MPPMLTSELKMPVVLIALLAAALPVVVLLLSASLEAVLKSRSTSLPRSSVTLEIPVAVLALAVLLSPLTVLP